MIAHPSEENSLAVITRLSQIMDGFVVDRDFIDMLRMAQVTLHRSPIAADRIQTLAGKLGDEFPSNDTIMNRELCESSLICRSPLPCPATWPTSHCVMSTMLEKLHLALHLRYIKEGWPEGKRTDVIKFLEDTKKKPDVGSGVRGYLTNIERDIARSLSVSEGPGRCSLSRMAWSRNRSPRQVPPQELDDETFRLLKSLDEQLVCTTEDSAVMLRTGIMAVLARSGQERAFEYLRDTWKSEPERCAKVAMGLAQQPSGSNWTYLVAPPRARR